MILAPRLIVDLEICRTCDACTAECSYPYHAGEGGPISLLEAATLAVICRRCEEGTCMASCPRDALKRGEDGRLRRSTLRCVACKSCSHACPFGTLRPEHRPYAAGRCDRGVGRRPPLCVSTCPKDALRDEEAAEGEPLLMVEGEEDLAVKGDVWSRQ